MTKRYWKYFATAIAALSAAATLTTALFKLDCIRDNLVYGIIGSAIVLIGSLSFAAWQTWSNKSFTVTLSKKQKVTVCKGDLFQKNGIICIPFNEYFDTHVGDGVVDKDSLHGIFINKYFKDRINELEEKIKNASSDISFTENKRRLDICPTKRYSLGTCLDIRDGENLYVLFALTHFDEKDNAYLSRAEFTEVTHKLMMHISTISESKSVYMPLFGTKLSRLHRTPQRILLHLIDTIDFSDKWAIPGEVTIVIKSLDAVRINLNTVEYLVKEGITEKE